MKKKISIITLLTLAAGIIYGLVAKELVLKTEFIGTFYLTFLKYMILPVIFTSISVSVYQSARNTEGLVLKTVILFMVMFVLSFLLSSAIITVIDPAKGFTFIDTSSSVTPQEIRFIDLIINLIPKDIKGLLTGKYLFFVIVVSYLTGMITHKLKAETFISYVTKLRDFLYQILGYLIYVTPAAVFSLISVSIYKFGVDTLLAGLKYILTAYICGLAVLVFIMMVPIKIFCRLSVRELFRKIYPIWMMTLSTCSSAATLPYTIKLCKEDLDIDPQITDIVVPLGCTIHMCGGAVSFSLLGLFCAGISGVTMTLSMYLYMLVTAVALNMSAPGIPNGGVVIGATYLEMMGLPLDFIGMYAGIYKILDMLYTTLNVTGDISANVILNHSMKKKADMQ